MKLAHGWFRNAKLDAWKDMQTGKSRVGRDGRPLRPDQNARVCAMAIDMNKGLVFLGTSAGTLQAWTADGKGVKEVNMGGEIGSLLSFFPMLFVGHQRTGAAGEKV